MFVLRPLAERVEERVLPDRAEGRKSTYVKIYGGEDTTRSTYIAARKIEELGIYATVTPRMTRGGRYLQITYENGGDGE